jgi:hypothetical protein
MHEGRIGEVAETVAEIHLFVSYFPSAFPGRSAARSAALQTRDRRELTSTKCPVC